MKLKDGQKYRIKNIDKSDARMDAPLDYKWNIDDILCFDRENECFHREKGFKNDWWVGDGIRTGFNYSELLEEMPAWKGHKCETCGQRVRVEGRTTQHYVGVDAEENEELKAKLEAK